MPNSSIVAKDFSFQSNTIRPDGLVNITALSTVYRNATGKRKDAKHWLLTKEATESIAYLERVTGILTSELVVVEHGVGTWVHADLAEIFAQWISVEYRFAVVSLIRATKEKSTPELQRQLPPARDIIDYASLIVATDWLNSDPILRSLVSQRLAEQLSPGVRTIDAPEQPLNVTSIASNLGYNQSDIGNGAKLGKYIAARHQPLGTSQHGKYQVNVYLPSEVSESIDAFFGKQLAIS